MTSSLPPGFTTRPPRPDDAAAIAAAIAACQAVDLGLAEMTTDELLADWHGVDLETEAIVLLAPDGRVAGYADVVNRSYVVVAVYGYVVPAFRGLGIGRFLVAWGERWIGERLAEAPADARVVVDHYIPATNDDGAQLLSGLGYAPIRQVYEMAIDLTDPPAVPAPPAGIGIDAFVPGRDERACHEAVEDAFRDVWSHTRDTFERFVQKTERADFDPGLWILARDGDEIAGAVLGQIAGDFGWIDVVGVRRPWRRRGLALALLRTAFAAYFRRGIHRVGLSVDAESKTDAPRLYLRAGMHVERSYVRHRKLIRPGVDYTASAGMLPAGEPAASAGSPED